MKFFFLLLLLSYGWVVEAKWSVATYNIRNFDRDRDAGQTNLQELRKIIQDIKSDVIAFEEVVNDSAFDQLIRSTLPGYQYQLSTCGGFGKQHLALVYNTRTFEYLHHQEDMSLSGSGSGCGSLRPLLLVTLRHKQSQTLYTFGVAHLKAGGSPRAFAKRWQQYARLERVSVGYSKQNLILLGDFNTTGYSLRDEDYMQFEDFVDSAGMVSVAENLSCTSYWRGNLGGEEHQPSILDHIILQKKLMGEVEKVRVTSHCARLDCRSAPPTELGVSYQSVSDHCPVQITFK